MNNIKCFDVNGNDIENLTQWDIGQSLIIEDSTIGKAPIFHFYNKNSTEAYVVKSSFANNKITVPVPNILLQEGIPLYACMYLYSDVNTETIASAKTVGIIKIPVRPRPKPSEYEYVENIDRTSVAEIEVAEAARVAAEEERAAAEAARIIAENARQETLVTNGTDSTVNVTLAHNCKYIYTVAATSVVANLPENADSNNNFISTLIFTTPATIDYDNYTNFPASIFFKGDDSSVGVFVPLPGKRYTIVFFNDGLGIVGLVCGIER